MSDTSMTTTPSEGRTALGQCLGHFCTTERASLLARLWKMEEALRYIWDRCGPHTEIPPCRDAAERARAALSE